MIRSVARFFFDDFCGGLSVLPAIYRELVNKRLYNSFEPDKCRR